MRGSAKRRGKNRWALIVDLGYVTKADGTRKRNQKWISFRGTKREADQKLAELVRAHNRGEFVEPSKITVATWLTEWHRKVVEPTTKRRTAMMYDRMIQSTLTPKLGSIR